MLGELGISSLGDFSPYGVAVLFVLALLTGRLITKSSHEREIETLQKALELREASNDKLLAQQAKYAELALQAFKSIPREDDSNAEA